MIHLILATGDTVNDGNLGLFLFWLVIAALVAFTIWASRLQKQEKLVIFTDYSDVTFTVLTPICPFILAFLPKILGLPSFVGAILFFISLIAMVSVVVIRSAYFNNGFLNIYFYISFFAKVLSSFVVVALVALVMMAALGGPTKKHDESELSWQLRKEKAKADHAASVAAGGALASAGIIGLIHLFTKNTCFAWDSFFEPVLTFINKIQTKIEYK